MTGKLVASPGRVRRWRAHLARLRRCRPQQRLRIEPLLRLLLDHLWCACTCLYHPSCWYLPTDAIQLPSKALLVSSHLVHPSTSIRVMAGPAPPPIDEAIRVVVAPSQASYFAGEPFSVSITFTNTRTPEAPVAAPRSSSHTHRRGAHSISSVPLSRPPTSPGTPRTVVPVFLPRSNNGASSSTLRKGLIGHSLPSKSFDEPPSAEVLRKRLLASRSLSATLSPSDLQTLSESDGPGAPATRVAVSGNGNGEYLAWVTIVGISFLYSVCHAA